MLTTEDYKRLAKCKDTKDVLKALDAIENDIKGKELWKELKDKEELKNHLSHIVIETIKDEDNGSTK